MLRPTEPHVLREARMQAERRFIDADADVNAVLQRVFNEPNEAKEAFAATALEGSPDYLANDLASYAGAYGDLCPGYEHHLIDLRDRLKEWFASMQDLEAVQADYQANREDQAER